MPVNQEAWNILLWGKGASSSKETRGRGQVGMEKNLRDWTNQAVTLKQTKIHSSMERAEKNAITHSEGMFIFPFFPFCWMIETSLGLNVRDRWGKHSNILIWATRFWKLFSLLPSLQMKSLKSAEINKAYNWCEQEETWTLDSVVWVTCAALEGSPFCKYASVSFITLVDCCEAVQIPVWIP